MPRLVACLSEFVSADASSWVRVFPLKRPSICGVGIDIAEQLACQIRERIEESACDHIALVLPALYLVGAVLVTRAS
jgi:hypothetical protein